MVPVLDLYCMLIQVWYGPCVGPALYVDPGVIWSLYWSCITCWSRCDMVPVLDLWILDVDQPSVTMYMYLAWPHNPIPQKYNDSSRFPTRYRSESVPIGCSNLVQVHWIEKSFLIRVWYVMICDDMWWYVMICEWIDLESYNESMSWSNAPNWEIVEMAGTLTWAVPWICHAGLSAIN